MPKRGYNYYAYNKPKSKVYLGNNVMHYEDIMTLIGLWPSLLMVEGEFYVYGENRILNFLLEWWVEDLSFLKECGVGEIQTL